MLKTRPLDELLHPDRTRRDRRDACSASPPRTVSHAISRPSAAPPWSIG